jgi:FkbM family methyltransferase
MLSAIKRRLIKIATRVYDPITTLKIGNQSIKIPLSHQLIEIVKIHPEYNFNLARIVNIVNRTYPGTKLIDIGANIGDTVAFVKNLSDVPILCIDGDQKYMSILKKNIKKYTNVFSCQALVGAENKDVNFKLKSDKGTAHIEEGPSVSKMRTLSDIIKDFPDFKDSKILKSDTDGFDTIILRSCVDYLTSVKPILFFEFDPHLIKKSNDDAFDFMNFLLDQGYYYFVFYTNIGDYLVSCNGDQKELLTQLIHYFSGRKLELFADICAFHKVDKFIFDQVVNNEIIHFRKIRNY